MIAGAFFRFSARALRSRRVRILILPLLIGCGPGTAFAQKNPDIYFLPNAAPFTPYAKLPLLLGNGFTSGGGKVTVKLVGNEAANTGYLYFVNPVTGVPQYLFMNNGKQGTVVDLGPFTKGAPIVFMYVADKAQLIPKKYTGSNVAGTYNFDANPALAGLFVNHKAMPVSDEKNNRGDGRWAVSARASCTDVVFGFEDMMGGDYDFNDIVFVVTGVTLDSEVKLPQPAIAGALTFLTSSTATLTMPAFAPTSTRMFYTLDGSAPAVDAKGVPLGTTREYTAPIPITQPGTLHAIAWLANASGQVDSCGSSLVYLGSDVASAIFSKTAKLDPPAFNPPGGTPWSAGLSVTLTQAQGAEIHFVICALKVGCADPDSSSPIYTAPLVLAQRSQIKAKAYKTGFIASDIASASYDLGFKVVSALYLDLDGDGHIDAARILLNLRPDILPDSITLEDPFLPGASVRLGKNHAAADPTDANALLVRFPDQPFRFGTGFPDGPYGRFPSGPDSYDTASFVIQDGVGPVLVSAEASPRVGGLPDHLRVVFSEYVQVDAAALIFSFSALHPDGKEFGKDVVVTMVRGLGGMAFEYTLAPGTGPQARDSLKSIAHATTQDLRGNQSHMGYYVMIGGLKPITANGGGFVIGGPVTNPVSIVNNVSVVIPSDPASKLPGTCLDCKTGEWKRIDPARPSVFPKGPEIRISAKGAFRFDFAFYDHFGQFVNRAQGTVTENMLQDVPVDSLGGKTVGLMWYPVSSKGQQVGTGVYIAIGTAITEGISGIGPHGETVRLEGSHSRISLRLGYVR